MNARESLVHAVYPEAEGPGTNELLDAYRAEVLAEAKTETVAWLVKKAAEQQTWDAAVLASKIDRGAVRAFIGTAHHRDAMDALRAQVLNEAADVAEMVGSGFFDNAHSGEGNGAMAAAAELRERAAVLTPASASANPGSYAATRGEPGEGGA